MAKRIQLRRDTAANWSSANPTLALGEVGFVVNGSNNAIAWRIGNGSSAWAALPEYQIGGGGDGTLQYPAGENISALRVVYILDGVAYKADQSNLYETSGAIGLTTAAASIGQSVTIKTSGELSDNGWNWSNPTNPAIYLGADGALTQTAPTSGYVKEMAVAVMPTMIHIKPHCTVLAV